MITHVHTHTTDKWVISTLWSLQVTLHRNTSKKVTFGRLVMSLAMNSLTLVCVLGSVNFLCSAVIHDGMSVGVVP